MITYYVYGPIEPLPSALTIRHPRPGQPADDKALFIPPKTGALTRCILLSDIGNNDPLPYSEPPVASPAARQTAEVNGNGGGGEREGDRERGRKRKVIKYIKYMTCKSENHSKWTFQCTGREKDNNGN